MRLQRAAVGCDDISIRVRNRLDKPHVLLEHREHRLDASIVKIQGGVDCATHAEHDVVAPDGWRVLGESINLGHGCGADGVPTPHC